MQLENYSVQSGSFHVVGFGQVVPLPIKVEEENHGRSQELTWKEQEHVDPGTPKGLRAR